MYNWMECRLQIISLLYAYLYSLLWRESSCYITITSKETADVTDGRTILGGLTQMHGVTVQRSRVIGDDMAAGNIDRVHRVEVACLTF